MKIASYIGLLVGLAILTILVTWQGAKQIAGLFLASGWVLLLIPLIWSPTVLLGARGWHLLFAREHAPTFWQAFYAQWMGRAVNTLLPVADVGGEVVKARMLILWGIDARHASASVVVDKTLQGITIVLWGLTGVNLLVWMAVDNKLIVAAFVGLAILGTGIFGFLIVQRAGMFGFFLKYASKVVRTDYLRSLVETANEVDRVILDLYGRPGRIVAAALWRFAALVLQSGEVWLAAQLLGHPIAIIDAVLLKSLSSTLSDAAFVVPNSYGIQEGAYVVLGGLVGLSPEVSLAISLATRIREVLIDVPGLVLWQHAEGRALVRRRRSNGPGDMQADSDRSV